MSSMKVLGALAVVAGGIFAVACSGGDATGGACGADCPAAKPARKPTSGDPLGTPTGGEEGTETPPTAPPDAGADTSTAPPAGPRCTALSSCCKELGAAGYVTKTCDDAVAKHDEPACTASQSSYVSFGDCTSPFGADCTQLNSCCAQIKASGAPSNTCEEAAAKKDQAACKSALTGYKAYGPCT